MDETKSNKIWFFITRLVLLSCQFIKMMYENQRNSVKVVLLRVNSPLDTTSWKVSWVSASIIENRHLMLKTDSEFSQQLLMSSIGLDLNRSRKEYPSVTLLNSFPFCLYWTNFILWYVWFKWRYVSIVFSVQNHWN